MTYVTRPGEEKDIQSLLEIYNDAVENSTSTFDLEPQTTDQRSAWFKEHTGEHPLVVVEDDGLVVGYATLSAFRDKPAYSKTAESSVYVRNSHRGKGIGRAAMDAIISKARELGFHTMVAGIVPPNEASVRLHMGLGFEHVADFREVGFKFGRWLDVRFYQLALESAEVTK
ncbi:MAG: N-acetyltransferase [Nitrososphaerota archaeon]|nr:N-acetyltransferase [Nitrososphaerota archaeon]